MESHDNAPSLSHTNKCGDQCALSVFVVNRKFLVHLLHSMHLKTLSLMRQHGIMDMFSQTGRLSMDSSLNTSICLVMQVKRIFQVFLSKT